MAGYPFASNFPKTTLVLNDVLFHFIICEGQSIFCSYPQIYWMQHRFNLTSLSRKDKDLNNVLIS